MADISDHLSDKQRDFIRAQKMFFVATAPLAADGSVDRWRRFFVCRIHRQAGLRWDSLRSPFAAKILCLRPGAALALCSRLRLCSSFRPLRAS